MILLNEISKMQGNNKNKLYMSKLIKIMVIPSTFPTILFPRRHHFKAPD